jgi:hypothetical protein
MQHPSLSPAALRWLMYCVTIAGTRTFRTQDFRLGWIFSLPPGWQVASRRGTSRTGSTFEAESRETTFD